MNELIDPAVSSNDTSEVAAMPVSQPHPQQTPGLRVSRDEMNLAEFPLTVLSKRADPSIKTLEFSDTVKGKNGELINRAWIITGADKFGLPTSSDDEVLLGLLKLTVDDGVRQRKIHFTRYELLKILRWTTEGRSYSRLQNALDRLSGVRIKATNAFYDNETKLHSTRNFGIIDAYEINDGRDTRPSFFTWSEVLFKSFQVGFIKKLDLDFYLDLKSAVSKRLYRYLDKHFWYRSRIQVNLFTLAHEKIGISRNYVYASSLRQQIEPALEELIEKNLLKEFEFIGKGKSTELVLIAAQGSRKLSATSSTMGEEARIDSTLDAAQLRSAVHSSHESIQSNAIKFKKLTEDCGDTRRPASIRGADKPEHVISSEESTIEKAIIKLLVERGIVERQGYRLIAEKDLHTLERIQKIIEHFDSLVGSGSHLVSRNPSGFLYRAIERPFEFVLPGERGNNIKRQSTLNFEQERAASVTQPVTSPRQPPVDNDAKGERTRAENAYSLARLQALEQILSAMSAADVQTLKSDVETSLSRVRAHISPQRFEEVIQHGVEQRLLDKHSFPDLERWLRERKG